MTTTAGVTSVGTAAVEGYTARFMHNANSIFDPLSKGVPLASQQPRYYDQWTNIYNRYLVRKAWLKIVRHCTSTQNDDGGYMWLQVRSPGESDVFDPSTYKVEEMLERATIPGRNSRYKRLIATSGGQSKWESTTISCVPNFQLKSSGVDTQDNDAVIGANPSSLVQFITDIHTHQAGSAGAFWFDIVLVQEVILYNPKTVLNQ